MSMISTSDLTYMDMINYPDFNIQTGKITFIDGESGSGKSTLLKLLNGTISPSSGLIKYNNKNIDEIHYIELRKKIMLVSQDIFLFDGSIKENFEKFYNFRNMKCIDDKKIKYFLEICCGNFDLSHRCENLSGGERQKVFTSIYLSFKPEVLLLDEPTASLDEITSNKFFKQVIEFCKKNKITMICVCHNPNLVKKFAENIITLRKEPL